MDIRYALLALAVVACSGSAAPDPSPSPPVTPSASAREWRSAARLELRPVVSGPTACASATPGPSGTERFETRGGAACYVAAPPELSIARFTSVEAKQQAGTEAWSIELQLPADVGAALGQVTERYLNQPLMLVLDDQLLSTPTVEARVTDDLVITGNFTQAEAERIAARLRQPA